ncbi:MAG: MoaD/ThiS family protein [Flavobacteriales bacterium]|nr:MoaD/ThiS family protein [Flavobacteriales bacterium]
MSILKIKVIVFGIIAERIQTNELVLENIQDTDSLWRYLVEKYPLLKDIKISIAVNKHIINHNTLLNAETEVALLPPFSGG